MSDRPEAVAIIGMSCRFPGAKDLNQFWDNLQREVESIRFFSRSELLEAGVDPNLVDDPSYVPARGALEGIDEFDAQFFEFSPREAELTDPQHRIFLEICWEALESAGIDPDRYDGLVGVFGGAGVNTYLLNNLYPGRGNRESPLQTSLQNKTDHLTTRVAYKLNLGGPAVTVQTACSTSLVAVCLACQSLLTYQCDAALAGGVTVTVPQISGYLHQTGGIASPDGHCRAFDARAEGTVDGSGAGVVVLKRLDEAVADRDPVLAVIRGFAVNNDGSEKAGYTAPSVARQAEVIALAQEMAGIDPAAVSYIEAHGTGTPLGDPIEVAALTQAFRRRTRRTGFCGLGSVKTNTGHLDAAAGVAGLIKTVLALGHEQIPPSLHFRRPNPQINFADGPFFVVDKLTEWKSGDAPRRAGVSSFGIGGTNAHIVLEEAPRQPDSEDARSWQVLLLSAQSDPALERATENLAEFLTRSPAVNLSDAAYTLQTGRKELRRRRAVLCRDREDAVAALRSLHPERVTSRLQEKGNRPVFFMFPGQGSQYSGMAGGLYREAPYFREQADLCFSLVQPHLDFDLKAVLYPDEAQRGWAARKIDQTEAAQPALFVVEYALAQLWMHWGIRPQAMIGHSLGEYVAACLAGVLTLEEALELVALRGQAMGSLEGGAMTAVTLPEKEIRQFLKPPLSLAAVNGPSLGVVSGPAPAVVELERRLGQEGVVCRRVPTSHAFHSPMMEGAVPPLRNWLSGFQPNPPQIPYLSNLTGDWVETPNIGDGEYWIRHMLGTVRFAEGAARLLERPNAVLLEVGPGRTLKTITRWHHTKSPDQVVETSLPDRGQDLPDAAALAGAAGRLWTADVSIDWRRFHEGERRRRIALPTYPFERRRYWIDPENETGPAAISADLGRLDNWFYRPRWEETAPLPSPSVLLKDLRLRWLLLTNDRGPGLDLARRLTDLDQVVAAARPGKDFGLGEDRVFHLNPRRPADYERLLEKLEEEEGLPERIVHLWTLTPPGQEDTVEETVCKGFESLLFLAQALGRIEAPPQIEILLVSNQLHPVHGLEPASPAKATALGPCRVIPREYPQVRCRSVDVVLPPDSKATATLADQILAESLADETRRPTALRGKQRWTLRYARIPLAAESAPVSLLRERGVYLITGGLGGVGLQVAAWLARNVQARLALAGRSDFPAPDRWESWLREHSEGHPQSRKIRTLQGLVRAGAEVWPVRADVTQEPDLRRLVERIKQRWGRLHGVVHAAGVPGGGLIQSTESESANSVMAPKVCGALALESVLRRQPLDFLALFSSLSSIVGRPGQVAYSAANAFLDSFAHDRGRNSETAIFSINWGEWQDTGMAARSPFASHKPSSPEPLGHPFLETRRPSESGGEIFTTDFSVDRHWVLDEHRLVGHPVVPGVAFIEMVRAALEGRIGNRTLQLEDLFFVAPLRVREDRTLPVRLVLEPRDGDWIFTVEADADGPSGPQIYAQGKASIVDARPPENFRLAELMERCRQREEIFSEEEREEDLGPRWQNVKKGRIGENQVLTELELPPQFVSDFERIGYHPALMDRATGRAQEYLVEGVYMPVSYRRLRIHSPIVPRIFSYSQYKPDLDPTRETLTFDTWVMDESGRTLVEIEGFTQKRINDAAEAIKSFALRRVGADEAAGDNASPQSLRDADQSDLAAMTAEQGLEAFRRILLHQPGPQVAVSARDLESEIESADQQARRKVLATLPAETSDSRSSGKQGFHPRPELKTQFAAPRSDEERLIANAWSRSLRIEQIGVDDNFFELGGDSVQAIQIIADLNRQGVELSPQQFFQRQSIAELAKIVAEKGSKEGFPRLPRGGGRQAVEPWTVRPDQLERLAAQIEEADAREDSEKEPAPKDEPAAVEVEGKEIEIIVAALRRHPAVREAVCTRSESSEGDRWTAHVAVDPVQEPFWRTLDFSLFYFADDSSSAKRDKYQLYVEGARFADEHGLTAVWTPERHFHNNGGLYPNPSVLSAALATVTRRVGLRAGSVVLPLHDPLRVAEEWSVVDNLSGGRVGVSFTSGWIPRDFALNPGAYADKRQEMERSMQTVQRLWRGKPVEVRDGAGNPAQVEIFPKPIQAQLPIWLTCSGDPAMFVKAGELGVNVLTALLAQSAEEAAEKIALYRDARRRAGHSGSGQVTMMLHAFLGGDEESVRRTVRDPLCRYLKSHVGLIKTMADSLNLKVDLDRREWTDQLVSFAFERYYETASLLGTPARCLQMAKQMRGMGVDEIACLIDFGVPAQQVLDHLTQLLELRDLCQAQTERLLESLRLHADRHLPASLRPSRFVFHDSLDGLKGSASPERPGKWEANSVER